MTTGIINQVIFLILMIVLFYVLCFLILKHLQRRRSLSARIIISDPKIRDTTFHVSHIDIINFNRAVKIEKQFLTRPYLMGLLGDPDWITPHGFSRVTDDFHMIKFYKKIWEDDENAKGKIEIHNSSSNYPILEKADNILLRNEKFGI